jgi:hypothetical protein
MSFVLRGDVGSGFLRKSPTAVRASGDLLHSRSSATHLATSTRLRAAGVVEKDDEEEDDEEEDAEYEREEEEGGKKGGKGEKGEEDEKAVHDPQKKWARFAGSAPNLLNRYMLSLWCEVIYESRQCDMLKPTPRRLRKRVSKRRQSSAL